MNAKADIPAQEQAPFDIAKLLDPQDNEEGLRLDFKRILWGVWQRKLIVILLTVLFALTGLTMALTLVEPVWKTSTTLIKKEQQDEFRVGRYGIPFKAQPYSFKTLLDTLMLPGTLERAMKRGGVYMAPNDFFGLVDLRVGKESKAFSVSVTWTDPETAAALTNHLADVFIERNRDMRKQEVETQLINYRSRLESARVNNIDAAESLRNFEAENEISDIQTQLTVLLEKRQEVEVIVTTVEGDLLAKREQVNRLANDIGSEPDMIVQTSYFVNPMAKNLAQLEWELAQARGRYTDDNPKVKDLLHRIDEIKTIIEDGKDEQTPSQTFAHNPVKQELSITRYEVQAEVLRLETQRERLLQKFEDLSSRITRLTETRKQHEVLMSRRDAADRLMKDLRERVDSMEVLYRGELGDFEVLERAVIPREREATGRKIIVIAMTLLGGLVGLGYALAMELLNPSLRTLKDLGFLQDFEVQADFISSTTPRIDPRHPSTRRAMDYRRFSNDLQIALDRTGTRSLCFASVSSDSGASTAAMNTALSLYLKGENVIFVDADLRADRSNLVMHATETRAPLQSLLRGKAEFGSLVNGLTYIPAAARGARSERSVLEIGGRRMTELKKQLDRQDAYIIYNLPPLGEEEAAFEALKHTGSLALVARSSGTMKRDVTRMLERLEHHGIRCVAGLMTDVPEELSLHGEFNPREDLASGITTFFRSLREAVSVRFARLIEPKPQLSQA